ncbi:MAG TPA: Tol-Pal system beta propeller repeat protein TolB [Myxococcales bacterium]|jgi:TolB protein
MRLFPTLLLAAVVCAPLTARAADAKVERPVLSLSGANFRPLPLAIAVPLYANAQAPRPTGQEIDETLHQDLAVSGLFELLDRKSYLAEATEGVALAEIKFSRWQDVGAEGLVKFVVSGTDPVTAEFHLYSSVGGKEELKKSYTAPLAAARTLAHRFADDLFTFYTREPGAFQTRLAFVRKVKSIKQVFVSDWDGQNARQITLSSLNLLPAWSADGTRLIYTGYGSGTPDLWSFDFRTTKASLIFHRSSALVTGGCYSQDGRRIAFAMSEDDGNSHLWLADANGENAKRLTDGFGINSSPTFSPDGKQLAFVSNRAGTPQIYVMPAEGGPAKRLTFQGNYNQTPDWSPRGDLIVFTARDERNVFDIFTVDAATGKIARLTQDQGNNEEPTFSPNGRLIAFTSTRAGSGQLFVMSADGNFQRQMTNGKEPVYTPAWGPFLKQ